MSPPSRGTVFSRSLLTPVLLLVPAGCGAGFAAFVDNGGDSRVEPPSLIAENGTRVPLSTRTAPVLNVRLRNFDPGAAAEVAVEIRAFGGAVVDRPFAAITAAQRVSFLALIPAIKIHLESLYGAQRALQAQDVQAEVAVLFDGIQVAPPLSLTFLRQPTATLDVSAPQQFVPASGAADVTVRLKPIAFDWTNRDNLDLLVRDNTLTATASFGVLKANPVLRAGRITAVRPTSDPEEVEVTLRLPPTDAPSQAHVIVSSFPSGDSSLVSNIFCNPVLLGTSPETGSTDGGTTVALFGQALVPLSDSGALLFESLRIKIRKGGRESDVPLNVIRKDRSTSTQLVFPMPSSPDGRPGPANIVVGMTVPAGPYHKPIEFLEETLVGAFTYGDTFPRFGPRGGPLTEKPVAIRVSPFVRASDPTGDVVSLINGAQNVPYVSLHATRGNGMFKRFGKPARAGNPEDFAQRNPVGICVSGFVDAGSQTAVIINAGTGQFARHSVLFGDGTTNPPLRFFESLPLVESGRACAAGHLNEDGLPDLVVVSAPSSVPTLYLSGGAAQFTRRPFTTEPVVFEFDTVAAADLDGDGSTDLVFAQAGLQPRVLVAYGNGRGEFPTQDHSEPGFDLARSGYGLDAEVRIVGIHAVGPRTRPDLALVLSGRAGSTASPPAIAHLTRRPTGRGFADLSAQGLTTFPGGQRVFVGSASDDLDRDLDDELVVASQGDPAAPLRILTVEAGRLELVTGAVTSSVDLIDEVHDVDIGVAVKPGDHNQPTGRLGVFLVHAANVGAGVEQRVSTFLVADGQPGPRILPASPARRVAHDVHAVAVGRFRQQLTPAQPETLDAWLAVSDGLLAATNDGLGEFALAQNQLSEPGLLPETLTAVTATTENGTSVQLPAVLTRDGRFGVVLPVDTTQITWARDGAPVDLRRYAPAPLRGRAVGPDSVVRCADVDGDDRLDLVVLLDLATAAGVGEEGEAVLLMFRGRGGPLERDEFPFTLPDPSVDAPLTHGNASSMVVGNFAISSSAVDTLELAVAVATGSPTSPVSGNHVRFYRFDQGSFVPSPTTGNNRVLIGGSEPVRMVADDYDRDGQTDLAVAYRRGRHLSVFYNYSAPSQSQAPEVDLTAFVEAPANPIPFTGEPREMIGIDINGDSGPDLVLATESTVGGLRHQDIVYFVSPGTSNLAGPGVVPPERTGNLVRSFNSWVLRDSPVAFGLGDLNGDASPDLVLGWAQHPQDPYNLRVLFGSSF